MYLNKKAISSAIATVLLILVAISGVAVFSGWFGVFETTIQAENDQAANDLQNVRVSKITVDTLYISSDSVGNFTELRIQNPSNGIQMCNFSAAADLAIINGTNQINLTNCGLQNGVRYNLIGTTVRSTLDIEIVPR